MKKYTSGAFESTTYGIYKSAQDTITSFPATIIADGENASAVIYVNMQQSGTPTPSSPIYPSECGELVSSNYTLPVISGGVTTSIDLSAVQSTRKIKKIVFSGSESWNTGTNNFYYYLPEGQDGVANSPVLCSHENFSDGATVNGTGKAIFIKISDFPGITTGAEFKQFCADQNAANTPLTIWYALSVDVTEIRNEPLRMIGDYADSVAAAAIPTTAGSQTFNIDTTLKPSSVSLTYTGWHTHSDKQYSGGQWGQVTSNAKVLRRKKSAKSKT